MEKQKATFKDLMIMFWTFFKIGLFTFGGGYAMITIIEKEIVQKHRWIEEETLSDMIAVAEATPGPIAVNMATFVGYQKGRALGAFFATLGIVLPSFIIIILVSIFLSFVSGNMWVESAFKGIRAGVVALVIHAGIKMTKQFEKTVVTVLVMLLAFGLATFVDVDVVWIILAGGVFGVVYQTVLSKRKSQELEKASDEKTEEDKK